MSELEAIATSIKEMREDQREMRTDIKTLMEHDYRNSIDIASLKSISRKSGGKSGGIWGAIVSIIMAIATAITSSSHGDDSPKKNNDNVKGRTENVRSR